MHSCSDEYTLLLLRPAFKTDWLGMVQHMSEALFVLSMHDSEFCPRLAGDITAEKLVEKKDFQVYLKMYCQAIKNGCRNAAWLGIRANDLVYPNVTLPDATEYTYVYLISCQGEVTKNARGSSVLVKVDMAVAPDLSCCEKHARIERHKGHAIRDGRMLAADAQQWAQLHPKPGGLFNASAAVLTTTTRPHATGLLAGPSLHTRHLTSLASRQST